MTSLVQRWKIKRALKNWAIDISSDDALTQSLQNKKVIERAKVLVTEPKILLCCYMIVYFPRNILSLDVFDYYLQHRAKKIIDVLDRLQEHYSWDCFVLFQWRFNKFITYFRSWLDKDRKKLVIPLVQEYWELEELKEKYEEEDKLQIESHQLQIKGRIRQLRFEPTAILNRFKDNRPSYDEVVAQSFYDRWLRDLYNDLKEEKYERIIPLLTDIKGMIRECIPNNDNYFQTVNDQLDTDILTNQLSHTQMDSASIRNLIIFIMNIVRELEAPDMDEDTDQVIALLDDMFRQKFSYAQILTFFMSSVFSKLEEILKRKRELMRNQA